MNYIKYPRTLHMPQSEGYTSDDKVLSSLDHLIGKEVVITMKMDGENTSIYPSGYTHARSIDSKYHESRTLLNKFANDIGYMIPVGYRICGENLYAKHSIGYKNLTSYFQGFSIWDDENICKSWDMTELLFAEIGITPVQVLFTGTLTESVINENIKFIKSSDNEGFVVRLYDSFAYEDFSKSVAKYVRKNHVTTDKHWMHQQMVINKLALW